MMGLKTEDECCQYLTNKESWYRCWECVEAIDKKELTSLRAELEKARELLLSATHWDRALSDEEMVFTTSDKKQQLELWNALRAEVERFRGVAIDTLGFAIEGWSYASDYFKDKWDYEGELERLRKRAGKVTTNEYKIPGPYAPIEGKED